MTNAPKISVIIPMFNAEKFIGECLESILKQTFQDFEVIVVNDCATDSSLAIVESYVPKFNGRLKVFQLEQNTGSGAVPRNTGLKVARGEYVFFVDADDSLTLTALEELYTLAKKFDAEVVYFEKYYWLNSLTGFIEVKTSQEGKLVSEPTFETEDLAKRIEKFFRKEIWVTPWCKLVRRELLIEHEIFFPPVVIGEDDIWTCGIFFHAKKILRVPNVVYIWRQHNDSMCRRKRTPQQYVEFLINPLVFGLKTLDRFMMDLNFFRQNPQYRYAVLEHSIHGKIDCLPDYTDILSAFDICEIIFKRFGKDFDNNEVLISVLFAIVCDLKRNLRIQRTQLAEKNNQLKNLSEQFQEVIDALQAQGNSK